MYFNTHLMLFRMGKLRLSVHRKNEMRKKYGFYPVRIPLKAISVLTVSVPLNVLSFEVSLPLSAYLESPSTSLPTLQSRIAAAKIFPQGMYFIHDCLHIQLYIQIIILSCRMDWCYTPCWAGRVHCAMQGGVLHLEDLRWSVLESSPLGTEHIYHLSHAVRFATSIILGIWMWRLSSRHWTPPQCVQEMMMLNFQI